MTRRWLAVGLVLLGIAAMAQAFDAVATLQSVDADGKTLHVTAGGRERTVAIADDATILDAEGQPLVDGLRARQLAVGAVVTLSLDRGGGMPVVTSLRLGGDATRQRSAGSKGGPAGAPGKSSVGLIPLDQMTATDRYKGEDGGLYGGGKNTPPAAHAQAAEREVRQIVPRDSEGRPSPHGVIVLVSISMSNATQEFSTFKQVADVDADKSGKLVIVDCAQGGQAMAQWVDPSAGPWREAERRLQSADVSNAQVQVAWIKLANKAPSGELSEHGRQLEDDTLHVVQNAKALFPNLRIAFLSSRTYGGYSGGYLNPEPFAYEGAFATRWLIQDQMHGDPRLAFAGKNARAPLLLWGPYLWADGTTPRQSDGLVWERTDFGPDATHPSATGRQKVAELLLTFFKNDPYARSWFVGR